MNVPGCIFTSLRLGRFSRSGTSPTGTLSHHMGEGCDEGILNFVSGLGTIPALACLAFALCVLLSSCSQKPSSLVLATVGDHKITVDDFQREVARRKNAHQAVSDKAALLEEMVRYHSLLNLAKSRGTADDPQVQREMQNLLIGKLIERELTPRLEEVTVSAEEIAVEYQANIAKYTKPAKVRLAMLFLEGDSKLSEARRAELRVRMAEARQKATASPAPNGFGALAIEYSNDQSSRYRGGDIGWLDAGNFAYHWPRSVLEAGYLLDPGKMSEVIETEKGFYLAMKTDARPLSITPLASLEPSLRQSLLLKKRRALDEAFRAEAVRLAGATIDQQALASVEWAPAPAALAKNQTPPSLPGADASAKDN